MTATRVTLSIVVHMNILSVNSSSALFFLLAIPGIASKLPVWNIVSCMHIQNVHVYSTCTNHCANNNSAIDPLPDAILPLTVAIYTTDILYLTYMHIILIHSGYLCKYNERH